MGVGREGGRGGDGGEGGLPKCRECSVECGLLWGSLSASGELPAAETSGAPPTLDNSFPHSVIWKQSSKHKKKGELVATN